MPAPADKPALRTALKSRLAMISPDERSRAADLVAEHLLGQEVVQTADTLLAYAALPEELNLDPFIISAIEAGKRVCLPGVDWERRALTPRLIENLDADLETGRYAVRSPRAGRPIVPLGEIDLVLVPGLAFDPRGGRLGRGAGFYDRLIAEFHGANHHPRLIGVCYEGQIVERVPTEDHDRRVDRVITEQGPLKGV